MIGCASYCATRNFRSPPDARLSAADLLLLRELAAAPRPTGTPAAAVARERCAQELRELGYVVTERPFSYSSLPGRFGTPVFGAAGAMLVGYAALWALNGQRFTPIAVLVAGIAAIVAAARWLTRTGVLTVPLLRATGVNLEAAKAGETPTVWLCAHVDSKSQPVPTLVRSAGLVLEASGLVMACVLGVVLASGAAVHDFYWAFAGAVTLAGAVPVVLSMTGTVSPGALDNASGVATIIAAARQLGDARGVGVLITDAEELGLAGARAWSRGRTNAAARTAVLNCDGVDDHGEIAVMRSGPLPERLGRALRSAVVPGSAVAIGPHFPGVLTDAVAFADAGLDAVTVSRGSPRSFLRVHSRRDDLRRLRGDGIAPTADFIAATARNLVGGGI